MLRDFCQTTISREDLATTLRVLRAFKAYESGVEWGLASWSTWYMLERFEDMLVHLVEGTPLSDEVEQMPTQHDFA